VEKKAGQTARLYIHPGLRKETFTKYSKISLCVLGSNTKEKQRIGSTKIYLNYIINELAVNKTASHAAGIVGLISGWQAQLSIQQKCAIMGPETFGLENLAYW